MRYATAPAVSWLDRPWMVAFAIAMLLLSYVGGVWLLWHSLDVPDIGDDAMPALSHHVASDPSAVTPPVREADPAEH